MAFRRNTKEEAKEIITELAESFRNNIQAYKDKNYKEQRVRQEYIDLFFKALNWDVNNEEKRPDKYKFVVIEDTLEINGQKKEPDYSFRYFGDIKFYVEAKKPSVDIKNDIDPAYQVRTYAYTRKLLVSILTDFEEFSVYDTKTKPSNSDKAAVCRIKYLTYDEYADNFDYIWDHFSFDAIENCNFEKAFETGRNKQGTGDIDSDLLKTIENWRLELAKNIALRNPQINLRTLNTAVQKIIDRIIFLRIAEDKDFEDYEDIKKCAESENVLSALKTLFDRANEKYNSGLFDNKDFPSDINIDEKVLKKIISELYYPLCPYQWKVLPVEILGNIYEKFLGSEIVFRNVKGGHTAQVEEKPEIKKAGGVYYTPQYIVKYIVENTLGERLKTFKPGDSLTVCDPACGSGSFLIGAYKYLLNWHLEYYEKDRKKYLKKGILAETAKGINLSVDEKKRILTSHIFGVDIDAQAVEVTKLSLFLQMLEEEGKGLNDLFRGSDLTVLPSLYDNIQSGNSLIGSDFYNDKLELWEDEELRYKINTFDWEKRFKPVFEKGGFDIVIGNPPYVSAPNQVDNKNLKIQRDYLSACDKYKCLYQKWDLYIPFMEKSLQILKENGLYSSIIPYPFTNQLYSQELKKMILQKYNILEMVDLKGTKVFSGATVTNCIPVIEKSQPKNKLWISKINENLIISKSFEKTYEELVQDNKKQLWNLDETNRNANRHNDLYVLGDFCYISKGMVLNADEKTAKGKFKKDDLISDTFDEIHCRKYIEAKDFEKYKINRIRFLEYNTKRCPDKLSRPTFKEWYDIPKLFINRLGSIVCAINFEDKILHNDSIIGASLWHYLENAENKSITTSIKKFSRFSRSEMEELSKKVSLKYLLGIINSKYTNILLDNLRAGDYHIYPEHIRNLPIPLASKEKQIEIENLTDKITEAKRKLEEMKKNNALETEIETQERFIDIIDNNINIKVYELYGLSKDEIAIIEKQN